MIDPPPLKISPFADRIFSDSYLKKLDVATLKRLLRPNLDLYVVAATSMLPRTLLWRGVRVDEPPEQVSRISYPPPHIVKLGRANQVGQPMFYCAAGEPAILFEMRARPGDLVALSAWSTTTPLWMHNLGFHTESLQRIGTTAMGSRQLLASPIPNESRRNARIRRLLSHAFTESVPEGFEYRYKQSIAIQELLLSAPLEQPAAGTVYPSLQLKGEVDNAVILPEFVDRALKPEAVQLLFVEAVDEKAFSYTVQLRRQSQQISDGRIAWAAAPSSQNRIHFGLENGTWVIRDDDGDRFIFTGRD